MYTIALCNHKGGTGKTTSTYNLGYALSEHGKKVLMIDLDPQGSLTISAGFEPEELEENGKTIVDTLIPFRGKGRTPIHEEVLTITDNLYLVPSVIDLAAADSALMSEINREGILKNALKDVADSFDYCLIDCPPTLSVLTLNALVAAESVLIPVSCDYLSYRGLLLLEETIENVKTRLNPNLETMGVLATFHNRTIHCRENLELLKKEHHVIGVIDTTVKAKDAIYNGRPIVWTDPESTVGKEYKDAANYILGVEKEAA